MINFGILVHLERQKWMAQGLESEEFKGHVKTGLLASARQWLVKYMPLHFLASAVERYVYHARGKRWQSYKRAAPTLRVKDINHPYANRKGLPNPNYHQTPAPLVWTGALRQDILQRPVDMYLMNARFTAMNHFPTVTIPVPLNHPINKACAGEITRLIPEEIEDLRTIAHAEFAKSLAESDPVSEEHRIA